MYIEFVISYVLIGILAVLLTVVIVLQCLILKKLSRRSTPSRDAYAAASFRGNAYAGGARSAICRNCATQFDAALTICPRCGTPR